MRGGAFDITAFAAACRDRAAATPVNGSNRSPPFPIAGNGDRAGRTTPPALTGAQSFLFPHEPSEVGDV